MLSPNSLLVWTERMLAALERGNDGRQWHTLIDKVWSPKNLSAALAMVVARAGAPGVDGQRTEAVAARAEEELATITRLLRESRYEPKPVRRVWIEKLGSREKRPLGIPTVRDRIVQTALLHVLEPIFERDFAETSYGFRPGRNAQQAIAQVEAQLAEGCTWVVDADLKGYFDTIPQEKLLARLREKVADSRLLALVEKFLRQGVMESAKEWEPTKSGTPQGAVISPLLANIYLDPLDHAMARRGWKMVRYADDFILLCQSESEAREVLAAVRQWVAEAGLTLHPEKTRLVNLAAGESFEFASLRSPLRGCLRQAVSLRSALGWHFERGHRWPREKSEQKLKEAVRQRTRRTSGASLRQIICGLNRVLRGWGNYFRGGVRNVPVRLDKWVRMRVRSVLRRRAGRRGRARGKDHQRLPNAWLTARGLISLAAITHGAAPSPAKA
jgi:RNA-directed DNA polymerase